MSEKKYSIPADEIKPMAEGYGYCLIPDTVIVSGLPIIYMYRDMPARRQNSGWRFFAGVELEEHLENPNYYGIYDVNIAANYTPAVIEKLDAPPYSAFQMAPDGKWADVSLTTDWADLN
ncbi:MAG: DUF2185 domain-containing protein [Oscillospiraceae bacterium]|nr:DUF2185 domain-containing protein [Oscillospiraceae bacterium]